MNDIFGGHDRRAASSGALRLLGTRIWRRWGGLGLIVIATMIAVVIWFSHATDARRRAVERDIERAADQVVGLVSDLLGRATASLALADRVFDGNGDIVTAMLPADGSDTSVPIADLLKAAESSRLNDRPGLTGPFQRDGRWFVALTTARDSRGILTAVIPLSGLHGDLNALGAAAGVDILIIAAGADVWWLSPLDEGALNLPVDPKPANAPASSESGDRLTAWLADGPSSHRVVGSAGLDVFIRPAESAARAIPLDYTGGALIGLTGLAGVIGCAIALRRSGHGAARASDDAAEPRDGGAESLGPSRWPDVPILAYRIVDAGDAPPVVALSAVGEPGLFGLSEPQYRMTVSAFLDRIDGAPPPGFADYLYGVADAVAAPNWIAWKGDREFPATLLHQGFECPDGGGEDKARCGLLLRAPSLHTAWLALQNAALDANTANISKSRFLARLSHELRTPLNAIIGFSELMEKEAFGPIGTPRYKGYLSDISASGQHLRDLINDIIDISRVESGELELSESLLEIRAELSSCVRLVRERLDASQLSFACAVPEDIPRLSADPLRFRQIMLNLLSNAIKFTPTGGNIRLTARILDHGVLQVAVCDTGIGMTAAGVRRAMEPFGRLTEDHYGPTEGTGLGLPIARGLTALHGGTLRIESDPGAGTTVILTFPAERLVSRA